MIIYIKK